ncbi:hypothetical protein [Demequina flava]|uniref:hypothetical protein n=1 Tax=Demequina flava TaxID=1095025 RepID=UPI000783CFE5|nr:hypothetical protein [Demequina flava]
MGWFDINTNHGTGRAHWDRTGHPECTAMHLTLNHVIYTLMQIAERDYKGEKCYQCPDFNFKGHPHSREHEVDFWLHRYYLPRVHDVWPDHSHADLDTYIAKCASELEVGWALEVAA